MTPAEPIEIARLLKAWGSGDNAAFQQLAAVVYTELKRIARCCMQVERPDNTLQSTALVHEAYLRLVDMKQAGCQHRAHFFAVSAQMMRRILVDAAAIVRETLQRYWTMLLREMGAGFLGTS